MVSNMYYFIKDTNDLTCFNLLINIFNGGDILWQKQNNLKRNLKSYCI